MVSPEFLPAFESLLREAGALAQLCRAELEVQKKPDGSLVTNADQEVEKLFRSRIDEITPGANVWGEEFGYARDEGHGLWVVDPVDGTSNFAFGSPLWGVTAAYIKDGELQAGGIFLPELDELYLASNEGGATLNGESIKPIPSGEIEREELVSCSQYVIKAYREARWPGKWRCSGSFVVDGAFVATQRFRGLIGFREKLYDIGAVLLICAELGAEIRYADGEPMDFQALLEDREIGRAWGILPAGCGYRLTESGK